MYAVVARIQSEDNSSPRGVLKGKGAILYSHLEL